MVRRTIFSGFILAALLLGCSGGNLPSVTQNPGIAATIIPPTKTPSPATPTVIPETDLDHSTDRPTPTLETLTPSPPITETPDLRAILDGKVIILRDFSTNYLEDITTGDGFIYWVEDSWVDVLQWRGNGCTLIAGLDEGIFEINLRGQIVRPIFTLNSFPHILDGTPFLPWSTNRYAYYPLSPDNSWIAYLIGSGNYEERGDDIEPFRFEYQDLETMSTDGTEGPYRLSFRGGVRRVAWSPDGSHLAFNDYDAEGISQLFIISRDGSNRQQLTFNTQPLEMGKILWSPDGERIALDVYQAGSIALGSAFVINLVHGATHTYENVRVRWWRDNDSLIAWHNTAQGNSSIIVFNATTGEVVPLGNLWCYQMNPFGNPAMVGCMTSDNQFWVYDSMTHTQEQFPDFDPFLFDIQYFIAAPDSYPGEATCSVSP